MDIVNEIKPAGPFVQSGGVKTFILRGPGTNCDRETAFAFQKAGAHTDVFHINHWLNNKDLIHRYQILVIPGGFSYGDDLGAGTVLGNEISQRLIDEVSKFVAEGKLILGICNGFQVLVKTGLLPGLSTAPGLPAEASAKAGQKPIKEAILATNDSAKYEDRWVYLKPDKKTKCVFTKDIDRKVLYLPVAHAEGKFIAKDAATLQAIIDNGQVVLRYCTDKGVPTAEFPHNPNGAQDNIAAICDTTGRILGMMPHPERFQDVTNHPRWTREKVAEPTDGMLIIQNAVNYVKEHL